MSRYRLFAIVLALVGVASTSASAQIVDGRKLEQTAARWERELRRAESPEQHIRVGEEAMLTFEEALTAKQFAIADRLAQAAIDAANEARNARLRQEALTCKYAVVTARREFEAMQQAGVTLGSNPRDSAANMIMGKYLCFTQRNWYAGFSKLMLCGDPEVQSLATRSFNANETAQLAEFRALGNAWWDVSLKRDVVERQQFQTAAVYYYARVKHTLDPKKRADVTVQKRIEAVSVNANKGRRLPSLIEIPIREDVRLRLRLIPAGTYLMGSPPFELHRSPTEAQKAVVIAQPFYMGQTEVTQKQWFALVPSANFCAFFDDERLPVDNVSWDRTSAFFEKLNVAPTARGYRFRLPTSAEWEYACRAGSRTPYFFGDDTTGLNTYAWTAGDAAERTHTVGLKKPNPWGLYDMLGNLREWTADRYDPPNLAELTDSDRAARAELRVVRGGSFVDKVDQFRSADMRGQLRSSRRDATGFRVACDILPVD